MLQTALLCFRDVHVDYLSLSFLLSAATSCPQTLDCIDPGVATTTPPPSTPTPAPDDGTCVPFDVSGTTVCVPEHLTPAAAVEHCSVSLTWKQLRNGWSNYGYVTGGLGKLMIVDSFEVWLCASSPHQCAATNDPFCFTYSEVNSVFVPWGLNSTLGVARTMTRRRSISVPAAGDGGADK